MHTRNLTLGIDPEKPKAEKLELQLPQTWKKSPNYKLPHLRSNSVTQPISRSRGPTK